MLAIAFQIAVAAGRRRRRVWWILIGGLSLVFVPGIPPMAEQQDFIELPAPRLHGDASLEDVLFQRRSVREFADAPISLGEAGQLLWAAQGETDPEGLRASPSAGALYPLEIYLVAGAVEGLEPGVYHYEVHRHQLEHVAGGDRRGRLAKAALGQSAVSGAAAVIAVGAVYERTTGKYGDRGRRYVHMEAGHAAQNVLLQASALGLDAVPVGAFDDPAVHKAVGMTGGMEPLYLLPIGQAAMKARQ